MNSFWKTLWTCCKTDYEVKFRVSRKICNRPVSSCRTLASLLKCNNNSNAFLRVISKQVKNKYLKSPYRRKIFWVKLFTKLIDMKIKVWRYRNSCVTESRLGNKEGNWGQNRQLSGQNIFSFYGNWRLITLWFSSYSQYWQLNQTCILTLYRS